MKRAGRPEASADAGSTTDGVGRGAEWRSVALPARLSPVRPRPLCLIVARRRSPPGSRGCCAPTRGGAPARQRRQRGVLLVAARAGANLRGRPRSSAGQFGNGPTASRSQSLRNRPDRRPAGRRRQVEIATEGMAVRLLGRQDVEVELGFDPTSCSCRKWSRQDDFASTTCRSPGSPTGSLHRCTHGRADALEARVGERFGILAAGAARRPRQDASRGPRAIDCNRSAGRTILASVGTPLTTLGCPTPAACRRHRMRRCRVASRRRRAIDCNRSAGRTILAGVGRPLTILDSLRRWGRVAAHGVRRCLRPGPLGSDGDGSGIDGRDLNLLTRGRSSRLNGGRRLVVLLLCTNPRLGATDGPLRDRWPPQPAPGSLTALPKPGQLAGFRRLDVSARVVVTLSNGRTYDQVFDLAPGEVHYILISTFLDRFTSWDVELSV